MPIVSELIRKEADGSISFGDYSLTRKSKKNDFEHNGDLYKVKTFQEITKLERNGIFVFESVPGTAVENLSVSDKGMEFWIEGNTDAQITLGLEANTEYLVSVDETFIGKITTNLSGKLVLSVELSGDRRTLVKVTK